MDGRRYIEEKTKMNKRESNGERRNRTVIKTANRRGKEAEEGKEEIRLGLVEIRKDGNNLV